jgi:hypothetical protein
MIIETKHSVGDWIYTIHKDEVVYARIVSISIEVNKNRIQIDYSLKYTHTYLSEDIAERFNKSADKCFATKEELLQSL